MHLVSVNKLKPGDVVGKPVFTSASDMLLAAGQELSTPMIQNLVRRGFTYIYVQDGVADDIAPSQVVSDTLRRMVSTEISQAYQKVKNTPVYTAIKTETVQKRLENDPKLKDLFTVAAFRKQALHLLNNVVDNNIRVFSALPVRSDDTEQFQHAVDTALLCILVGRELHLGWQDLQVLTTAAMLHDIGKVLLLEARPSLRETKGEQLQKALESHPEYAASLLKHSDPDSSKEQIIVQQHHERLNGSGYPARLRGKDIAPLQISQYDTGTISGLSMVLAVVNHYDNLLSGKTNGTLHSPEDAIKQLVLEAGESWNSHVVRALGNIIQLYPIGAQVRVIRSGGMRFDGWRGVVVRNNPESGDKPIILLTHNAMGTKVQPVVVNCAADKAAKLELLI